MGPRLFPWFNPYETHGEGLTVACKFVYPEMVVELLLINSVYIDFIQCKNLGFWIGHGNTLLQNFYLI